MGIKVLTSYKVEYTFAYNYKQEKCRTYDSIGALITDENLFVKSSQ